MYRVRACVVNVLLLVIADGISAGKGRDETFELLETCTNYYNELVDVVNVTLLTYPCAETAFSVLEGEGELDSAKRRINDSSRCTDR